MPRKACMVFKPLAPGATRRWVAKLNGVRYEVVREFTGEWSTSATIGRQTRPVGGSGTRTKASAIKVACDHAAFYRKYVKGR